MFNYMKYSRDPMVGNPEFGTLFFGAIYLMYRGLWGHALLMIVLILPTCGLVWIWYIFNTRKYITKKLAEQGYFDRQFKDDMGLGK